MAYKEINNQNTTQTCCRIVVHLEGYCACRLGLAIALSQLTNRNTDHTMVLVVYRGRSNECLDFSVNKRVKARTETEKLSFFRHEGIKRCLKLVTRDCDRVLKEICLHLFMNVGQIKIRAVTGCSTYDLTDCCYGY